MKVRPITITLYIEAVADDGENLIPVQIEPVKLMATQFAEFDLVDQLARVEEVLNAPKVS